MPWSSAILPPVRFTTRAAPAGPDCALGPTEAGGENTSMPAVK